MTFSVPKDLILTHVVVWGDTLFGVNRDNNIYVGYAVGNPDWVQLPGSLKQISTDGKQVCGANFMDNIWCADEDIKKNPNWHQILGSLKHVVVSNGILIWCQLKR